MEMAGVPVEFPEAGAVEVVVSETSRLSLHGWTGFVLLEGSAIATVPDAATAELVRGALHGLPVEDLIDLGRMGSLLPMRGYSGSLSLSYLEAGDFRPMHGGHRIEELPVQHEDFETLLGRAASIELILSGMRELESTVFVTREDGVITAAAGYLAWPHGVAHLLVLTAGEHRNRGLGRVVASAATERALTDGLFPQWRAQPEASRRIAAALGFRRYGHQRSYLLVTGGGPPT
jgi:GNAT superfamily N-acetyltransferase